MAVPSGAAQTQPATADASRSVKMSFLELCITCSVVQSRFYWCQRCRQGKLAYGWRSWKKRLPLATGWVTELSDPFTTTGPTTSVQLADGPRVEDCCSTQPGRGTGQEITTELGAATAMRSTGGSPGSPTMLQKPPSSA